MMRRSHLMAFGALLVFGATSAAQPPLTTGGYFQSANGSDKSAGLIGMTTIEANERPMACFGLTKPVGRKPQYSFLFIFNAPAKSGSIDMDSKCKGSNVDDDFHIDHECKLVVGKGTAEVAYNCKYDSKAKKMSSESLTVGGKSVDLDKGRVFLVDVMGPKASYTQMKFDLVPEFDFQDGYARWTFEAIEKLREDYTQVKKFLR